MKKGFTRMVLKMNCRRPDSELAHHNLLRTLGR